MGVRGRGKEMSWRRNLEFGRGWCGIGKLVDNLWADVLLLLLKGTLD